MSSSPVDLRVDWCSYKAAKYAVEHWHYSRTMPAGKTVKFGVWEDERFIGAVIFSRGANNNIGSPYGLKNTEVCELTRVALAQHKANVTAILSICIKKLKAHDAGLRLIVSYADSEQHHIGGIYQAGNWIYLGIAEKAGGLQYKINGKWVHKRTLGSRYGRRDKRYLDKLFPEAETRDDTDKHRYLYPLDRAMRRQIAPLAQPYPKRETSGPSVDGDTPVPTGEAGSTPAARS